jgi:hypothetical protein
MESQPRQRTITLQRGGAGLLCSIVLQKKVQFNSSTTELRLAGADRGSTADAGTVVPRMPTADQAVNAVCRQAMTDEVGPC